MPLHFKAYLQKKSAYQGGKSKAEIQFNTDEIHKLSSNENPLGASPKAIAAVQKLIPILHEYPDRTDDRLRKALSEFYEGQLNEEQFITTNSGVANLELIMHGFLTEGTECILSNPAFGAYHDFIGKTGATVIDVPLVGPKLLLDVPGIIQAITDRTRLIFVTNPNNPTGTYLPKEQIDALIARLPDHVVLVYDEVYYQYVDQSDYTTALPYVLKGKNVIAVNSFSKAYGLAGLRVGYSYSTPEIATYLRQLRRPFMINALSMEAAIAALQDEAFIKQTVDHVYQEKHFLYEQLDEMDCKYWKTQANFILVDPEMPADEFVEAMVHEGIMVRPFHTFQPNGCVRVSIGTRKANAAFVKAWKKLRVNSTIG